LLVFEIQVKITGRTTTKGAFEGVKLGCHCLLFKSMNLTPILLLWYLFNEYVLGIFTQCANFWWTWCILLLLNKIIIRYIQQKLKTI